MEWNVEVEKIKDGHVVDSETIHNALVPEGLKVVINWMMNYAADGSRGFQHIQFLDGTTSIANIHGSMSRSSSSFTIVATYENTGTTTVHIDNAKLNSGDTSEVLATTSFSEYSLDNGEKLKITWTVTFS